MIQEQTQPTQAPAARCELLPWPPSHWWYRDTVPFLRVLNAPGHGGWWQISWQGEELRETVGQLRTHARRWCGTSAAEILPRVLKPLEQRQGFKGDFIASDGCCVWVFVLYPCKRWARPPSPMRVRNFLKIALRRTRMLIPKCVGITGRSELTQFTAAGTDHYLTESEQSKCFLPHKSRWTCLILGRFYYQEIIFTLHLRICLRVLFGKASCCAQPIELSPTLCTLSWRCAAELPFWQCQPRERGPLPTPLLVHAAVEDPLLCSRKMPRLRHPGFGSVLNHNLHHKHTPKRGLIFSLHRWDRRHVSRQLLLPGKHESGRLLKFLKQRNFLSSNDSWMTQQPLLPARLQFIW